MFHTPRTNVYPVVVVLSSIRPVIRPVIHPSNFLIPEEEDDGRGGRRRKRHQQIKNFKLKNKKTSY
jgi:hypothetical protein